MVVHTLGERNLKNLQTPRKALLTPVPPAYRDSRSRLLQAGAAYYDALDENNGSLAPFADDCVRLENGFQTSRNPVPLDTTTGGMAFIGALGCKAQLDTQSMTYISRITDRRVWIADEEMGLALGFSHFRHAMDRKEYPVIGIPGYPIHKMDFAPFDLPALHVYKIWGGQIHEIEAIGFTAPYNSPTGWE
jgi:hypothetical protein